MYSIDKNTELGIPKRSSYYAKRYLICLMIMFLQILTGCRKFVEVDTPPDKVTNANVFSNDKTAASVLMWIYINMNSSGTDMAKYGGLLSDELTLMSGSDADINAYYTNFFVANSSRNTGKEIWNFYYNLIFNCNTAIEGLTASTTLTPLVKKQLLGEAYFLRAWFYFYLVNLYSEVPLVTTTNPADNRLLMRSTVPIVYQLIVDDLQKAYSLLSREYLNGQLLSYPAKIAERVRPTNWAAAALLSRAYLYQKEYAKAEVAANTVINNSELFNLLPYSQIFLKNSKEAIWQLQPIETGWNTWEARTFNLGEEPVGLTGDKPVYLSPFILEAFAPNDKRRFSWVDSLVVGGETYFFPVKYKIGSLNISVISPEFLTEYSMMLRLAEQYLIRAEARARQNNLPGAIEDLDIIRDRAGLPLIANINPGISQDELLTLIFQERRVELFTEWGHRWFDLKRSEKLDEVMQSVTPIKGGNWESRSQFLPIPYDELLYNPNLTQNVGY